MIIVDRALGVSIGDQPVVFVCESANLDFSGHYETQIHYDTYYDSCGNCYSCYGVNTTTYTSYWLVDWGDGSEQLRFDSNGGDVTQTIYHGYSTTGNYNVVATEYDNTGATITLTVTAPVP